MKDLYAVLRVKPNATPDEIKAAYREQARRTHPDVNRHVDALAQFQEVKEAYEVLGTPRVGPITIALWSWSANAPPENKRPFGPSFNRLKLPRGVGSMTNQPISSANLISIK